MKNYIGKQVIARSDKGGVIFGELVGFEGDTLMFGRSRKLHYWDGAGAIEQLSKDGTSKPDRCRFTVVVEESTVFGVCQCIPCTDKAIESINGVKEWTL